MEERELRESLREVGPLLPEIIYEGETIDGRKRRQLCDELGLVLPSHYCATLRDACARLWVLHPERAIALARTKNVHELAALCAAKPSAIAKVLQALKPPRARYLRSPRHLQGQKKKHVQLWVEPQLEFLARRTARGEGLNFSAFIREAIWYRIQANDARAPAPGADRAPRWVKPPEKRNRARRA